jgi:spore coat polysaccharide biosynthesis protein SpsF
MNEMKTENKVVCIVQARMGSSRLPGKVLKEICGRPMLDWVIRRAARAISIQHIMVATTVNTGDDPIHDYCQLNRIACYRGSEFDVLDRYYQAALSEKADVVVRLTADCPLIDPSLIDKTVNALLDQNADFAANRLPPPYHRTYPIGLDVEAATLNALEHAWKNASESYEREHVMPFLYDPAHGMKFVVVDHDADLGGLRWTVDTPEDLEFIREVTGMFDCRDDFSWLDVLKILEKFPELSEINSGIVHKTMKDVDSRANQF